jgi:long-chain acyl-CoA synthetase
MGLTPQDVVLGVLPFDHNYGMYGALLAPLLFGATVASVERFTPEAVFDAIRRHRVTIFPGVATMFRRLLNSPAFASADLSSLRLTVAGAAPCPWEVLKEWHARTGTRILRGYGMTEIPRPISYFLDDPADFPDVVGRAIPGVKIRVVDDAGRSLPYGEVGEMWIKSPTAMDGYLDAPEETQAVSTDGWIETGDLASMSREGFIRIVGRKRERILRGGFSVFPQEVEAVLLSHPAVAEAAVIGVPSNDLGEEVNAFVTLKPTPETTAEELIDHCKEHLAHYKFPRRVTILDELPKGTTGKVLKAELIKGHF